MSSLLDEIIKLIDSNGGELWSRSDGNIYSPIGFSSLEVLNVLGDLGLKYENQQIVRQLSDFIANRFDSKSALFSYSTNSSKLPCVSAKILSSLAKTEYSDKNLLLLAGNKLAETQRIDGGWRCSTVKMGKSEETDASNPGTTLYVLEFLRYFPELAQIVEKQAVNFLLTHWETRKPLGPCEFGIGSTFLRTEYPLIRYNILYFVFTLSHFNVARNDERFQEAYRSLSQKVIGDQLYIENPHKRWKSLLFPENAMFSDYSNTKLKVIKSNLT